MYRVIFFVHLKRFLSNQFLKQKVNMTSVAAFPILCLMTFVAQCSGAPTKTKDTMIDLAYKFDNATIYWPGAKKFNSTITYRGKTGNLPWYESNDYSAAEHGGTHLDAPAHFSKGKWRVDDIPLSRLIAPAVKVDMWSKTQNNKDYEITTQDLRDWEAENGRIEDEVILLLRTGWHQYYPNELQYMGNDKRDASDLHFPGLHPDAAKWLVANRNVYGVGIDTASIDFGQSIYFKSHQHLFGDDIYALENVGYLDKLPARGAMLYVMPMNIKGGSGAPCRITAVINGDTSGASYQRSTLLLFGVTSLLTFWIHL